MIPMEDQNGLETSVADLPAKADQREKPMKAVACSDPGTTS